MNGVAHDIVVLVVPLPNVSGLSFISDIHEVATLLPSGRRIRIDMPNNTHAITWLLTKLGLQLEGDTQRLGDGRGNREQGMAVLREDIRSQAPETVPICIELPEGIHLDPTYFQPGSSQPNSLTAELAVVTKKLRTQFGALTSSIGGFAFVCGVSGRADTYKGKKKKAMTEETRRQIERMKEATIKDSDDDDDDDDKDDGGLASRLGDLAVSSGKCVGAFKVCSPFVAVSLRSLYLLLFPLCFCTQIMRAVVVSPVGVLWPVTSTTRSPHCALCFFPARLFTPAHKASTGGERSSVSWSRQLPKNLFSPPPNSATGVSSFSRQQFLARVSASYNIHPNKGGGACLFRAFSQFLYADEKYHPHVRDQTCGFMTEHIELFSQYKVDDEYILNMRKEGIFGGEPEVFAAALLFGTFVIIHTPDFPEHQDGYCVPPADSDHLHWIDVDGHPIHLLLVGQHYELLMEKDLVQQEERLPLHRDVLDARREATQSRLETGSFHWDYRPHRGVSSRPPEGFVVDVNTAGSSTASSRASTSNLPREDEPSETTQLHSNSSATKQRSTS